MMSSSTGPDLLGNLLAGGNPESVSRPSAPQEAPIKCSRSGCTAAAQWRLEWNNPKIHDEDRRKVWLACDQHLEYLSDFLRSRSFLRDVFPMQPTGTPGTSEGNDR